MDELVIVFVIVVAVVLVALVAYFGTRQETKTRTWVGASAQQEEFFGDGDSVPAIDAVATYDANQVIPPQTTDIPRNPNGAEDSALLLATTSAANNPVFNTILNSELTLSQNRSMSFYTSLPPPTNTDPVPESFDARVRWPGLIGEPLDQLQCGSCWSFGVATMVADRIRIHSTEGTNRVTLHLDMDVLSNSYFDEEVITDTGRPLLQGKISYRGMANYLDTLSPYYFAGCNVCGYSFNLNPEIAAIFTSRSLCSNCCSGGVIQYALIWLLLNGVVQMSCTNSLVDYSCSTQLGCPVFRVKNIYQVNPYTTEINDPSTADPAILRENELAIMKEISTNGPVVASMYVYPNFASHNTDYVYDDTQGTINPGGHCVVIVGYGYGPNIQGKIVPYWLVRNSWSAQWGDKGYFKILRGSNAMRTEQDVFSVSCFKVYNLTKLPPTGNPLDSQAATLCSSAPSQAIVSPSIF